MRIDAFLRESPLFAVSRAARRLETLAARTLSSNELNLFEALILAALFLESPAPVKPSQLAEVFQTTRASVSHAIASLEAAGHIHRRIDPEDTRAFQLSLKPHGKRTALRVIAALDRMQKEYETTLGKATLRQTLYNLAQLARLDGA